jgi:hypothetical protein
MGLKWGNNCEGTLAAGISAAATSLTLTPGHGSRFPQVDFAGDGDYFFATLVDQSGNREVIKVKEHKSAVDIDQFSIIERAADSIQEVTTAYAFSAADRVQLRIPAIAMLSPDNTKADTFIIGVDTSGPTLKNDSGTLKVRNNADSADANLTAAGLTLSAALAIGGAITGATSITMSGALSGVTTLSMGGALSGVTTLAMGGALSGVTTISLSGAMTGGTNITISGTLQAEHLYTTDDLVVDGKITATAESSAIDIDNESAAVAIKARDHGTASTPEVSNVVYGTGSPPAIGTVPEGTLFFKYIT